MSTATETVQFATSYTAVPRVIAQINYTNGDKVEYAYNRMPHTLTISGFTRSKANSAIPVSWLSVGY